MEHTKVMIAEEIREIQRTHPSEPYTVVTNDGAELDVRHPDYLLIPPSNATVFIYSTETDRQLVAIPNITRIFPGPKKTGTPSR